MYAVIKTGGKQYRVSEGDIVRIEKLNADVGSKVTFDDVLLFGEGADIAVGADAAKVKVSGVVTEQDRDKKIVVFKKRRRKTYRRTMGHRQAYTAVQIEKISKPRAAAKKAEAAAEE